MPFPTIPSQGTTITIEDTEVVPVAHPIECITSFTVLDGTSNDKDRTCLTSVAREFAQGLRDGGNLSIELFYDPAQAGQKVAIANRAAQATTEVVITLSDATTITFPAYVKSIGPSATQDEDTTGTLVLKVAGEPVFA